MREYIIATDSTADLPEQYISDNGLMIFPLHYIINDIEYGREINDLPSHDFYQMMRDGSMPVTSATNQEYVYQQMEIAAKKNCDILYIGFSSGLSSSYSNGAMAAKRLMESYPGIRCIAIDTLNATAGQAIIVGLALKLKAAGRSIDETADFIKSNLNNIPLLFTVDDLFHLAKGGRLSRGAAALGTVINIKPMLHIEQSDGTLAVTGKVRGRKKAITALVEAIEGSLQEERYSGMKLYAVCVAHADSPEDASQLAALVKERTGFKEVPVLDLSPTLGAHAGAGTLVLGYAILKDFKV